MKKIVLIPALLFLFALPAFSQVLKPVKIDSLVTVSLPPDFQKKDTLGQQTFAANGLYGYMAVIRATNEKNSRPLKKETDLNKVMKDYIKTIQGESSDENSAMYVRDTTIGTLKAKAFTLQSTKEQGSVEYRNFVLIYTAAATYTFEYVYPDGRQDVIGSEYKQFLSSIKLSPQLQRNDQYLYSAKGMAPALKAGIIGIVAIGLVILITLLIKRRKLSV